MYSIWNVGALFHNLHIRRQEGGGVNIRITYRKSSISPAALPSTYILYIVMLLDVFHPLSELAYNVLYIQYWYIIIILCYFQLLQLSGLYTVRKVLAELAVCAWRS